MSVKVWIGNAHSTRQINTITVANTWAAGDTSTMTINTKDIVVTVGATGTSTANVAIALKEAWMSSTRLDGTGTTDATSNAGGQEFGEFAEVTATVSGSVVTLIANRPGVPFTLSVTETTAGTGTATGATTQAATGPHHWNNADNWDTGTVPVDDDVVVFRDSDVDCLFGLPDSTDLEVTINVYMSYQPGTTWGHRARVGLPRINRDDPSKPYNEYRQRYVRLDDGGTGTNIAHRFGIGQDGTGFTLFNLKHITVKCSPVVYNTGTPLIPGTHALNICCTANTSTLDVLNGSVDYSTQDGSTSAFVLIKQSAGTSRSIDGIHTSGAGLYVFGGNALVGGTGAIATIQCIGGTTRIEEQLGTLTSLYADKGSTILYAATATISTLYIRGGTFDTRLGATGFTVTNCNLYEGSKLYDPARRITFSNDASFYINPGTDIQMGSTDTTSIKVNYA